MAFDAIEPLDAAGAILRGLAGPQKDSGAAPGRPQTWQEQSAMLDRFARRHNARLEAKAQTQAIAGGP